MSRVSGNPYCLIVRRGMMKQLRTSIRENFTSSGLLLNAEEQSPRTVVARDRPVRFGSLRFVGHRPSSAPADRASATSRGSGVIDAGP